MSVLSGRECLDTSRPFDLIVAYPHSSNIEIVNGQLEPRLSIMSQLSIDAALETWRRHSTARIVIPGETCFPDSGLPNTTDLMVLRAKQQSKFVVEEEDVVRLDEIVDGELLNNTYLQTKALAEYVDGLAVKPRLLIETLGYHLERVRRTAQAYGLTADFGVAEDIVRATGNIGYDQFLPAITKGTRKTEFLAMVLTTGDRKGTLLNRLMSKAGARLVDVVRDEDGGFGFENSLAKTKFAKLQSQLEPGRLAQTA